jgi:pullulanase
MTTAEQIAKHIVFDNTTEDNLISYSIKDNANGDSWKEIKLIFNGSNEVAEVKVKKGEWTIIAQDGQLKADGLSECKGGKLSVAPCSALILARTK